MSFLDFVSRFEILECRDSFFLVVDNSYCMMLCPSSEKDRILSDGRTLGQVILDDKALLDTISKSDNNAKRLLAIKRLTSDENKHLYYKIFGYLYESLATEIKFAYDLYKVSGDDSAFIDTHYTFWREIE